MKQKSTSESENKSESKISIKCVIIAGIGGIAPTLLRLGSSLIASSDSIFTIKLSFVFGLLIFFFLGGILPIAFVEYDIKKAFLLGVAAPGIITSVTAGLVDSYNPHANVQDHQYEGINLEDIPTQDNIFRLVPSANAQSSSVSGSQKTSLFYQARSIKTDLTIMPSVDIDDKTLCIEI